MDPNSQRQFVSKYYGETLKSSADLRTSACCPVDSVPPAHKHILSQLHAEVTSRFYGCGSPLPHHLEKASILDLGCGTGRDAFLASALAGPMGSVIGVDMTEAQLEIGRKFKEYHSQAFFGDPNLSNVDFRKGYIEDLSSANITDSSMDVVISNCVCNLSPHKSKVFAEVFRVLKQGGEFYFSDVYADRRLTVEASKHPILVGECLGGALYLEDFRRIMTDVGFHDIRIVSSAPVALMDPSLKPLVPDVQFFSVTFRAFKVSAMDDRREDYSQTAVYTPLQKEDHADSFKLDIDNQFRPNSPQPIDSNTAAILKASRFKDMFKVSDRQSHAGLFSCQSNNASFSNPAFDCFRPARSARSTENQNCNATTSPMESKPVPNDNQSSRTSKTCCG